MYKNYQKKKVKLSSFKRWTRKNYNVFNSLKKQIVIANMVLAFSFVFNIKTIDAQTQTNNNETIHEMDEMVVTGEAVPVPFSQSARIVTVINREQIESLPVNDVNDLLEYALNVDVRQRGVHGVQADLSIRGSSFDQTLVLLNGINISDPQTGHLQLNLPIDLSAISRIEILNGPAARAYGVNAMSGVVNIITNTSNESHANLHLFGGAYGLLGGNATIHLKTGVLQHFLSASHKQSDGYLPKAALNNTDFKSTHAFYHVTGQFSPQHKLDAQVGYNTKAFGANSFYTPKFPNQFEATKTKFAALKYQFKHNNLHIKPALYYKRSHDRFELFRNNPASWYQHHNYHMTDIWGANLSSTYFSKYGNIHLGLQYRNEHIYSNVLGEEMTNTMPVPHESGAIFTKEKSRYIASGNIEYILNINRFHFAAGIMANQYSMLDEVRYFPSAEMNYHIYRGLRIFTSYNEALRLPTFIDLYYNGPTNIGNPNLKPEMSKTMEAGLKYIGKAMRIQAAYFYRSSNNLIDWVKTEDDEKWTTKNLTHINASGFEFAYEILPQLYDADFFITDFKFSYAYTNLDKDAKGFISKYALDYLKHKVGISLSHKIYKKLTASWGVTYQDREGGYLTFENQQFGAFTNYKPFWLLDMKLMYNLSNWKFYVSANNLLNTTYYDFGNVPQPGRWISGGVTYQFSMKND